MEADKATILSANVLVVYSNVKFFKVVSFFFLAQFLMFCPHETFYSLRKTDEEAEIAKKKWWRRSAVPRTSQFAVSKTSF